MAYISFILKEKRKKKRQGKEEKAAGFHSECQHRYWGCCDEQVDYIRQNSPLPRTCIHLSKHITAISESYSLRFILADSCLWSPSGSWVYFDICSNLILCGFSSKNVQDPWSKKCISIPRLPFCFSFFMVFENKALHSQTTAKNQVFFK